MNFIQLVQELKNKGITILSDGAELNISAPKGAMTPELLEYIKAYKADFIELLSKGIKSTESKPAYDLSPSQKRFWILSKFEGGNLAYNIPFCIKINETIDAALLGKSVQKLIARHAILRTVFKENEQGEVKQFILDEDQSYSIESLRQSADFTVSDFFGKMNTQVFDLSEFPLFHISLFDNGDAHTYLHISIHHIISDEWSVELFFRELLQIYSALATNVSPNLPETRLRFVDYSEWLNHQLNSGNWKNAEDFWMNQFQEEVADLTIPTSFPRPIVKTFNGSAIYEVFSEAVYRKITDFTRNNEVTLFTTLFTAVNAILHRYSSQREIVLGIPVSGRELTETKDVMGLFINSLPIKSTIAEKDNFRTFLEKEKTLLNTAYTYQQYPFDLLIEKLKVTRDPGRSPLFDFMMTIISSDQSQKPGTSSDAIEFLEHEMTISQFDIVFRFIEEPHALGLKMEYNTDIYDEQLIRLLFEHLERFIDLALSNSSTPINELNYLSETEQKRILDTFNDTEKPIENDLTIVKLINNQVKKNPDKTAILYNDRIAKNQHCVQKTLTYSELEKLSNQFAHYLLKNGVKKGDNVCVELEKSELLIVVLLGILKAGGVYVPVDPDYPEERKNYFKTLTECVINIDEEQLVRFNESQEQLPESEPEIAILPSDRVHIMFTSGSTGTPKGVMLNHRNIVGLIHPVTYMDLNESTILLSTVSVSFDTTNMEFWGVLANGGKVILEQRNALLDLDLFKSTLIENKVTTMFLTSSWFENIAETDHTLFGTIQQFLTGGDMVSFKHINLLRSNYPDLKIIHCYGPTEDTTFSTTHLVEKEYEGTISIGKPIDNGQVYILNEKLLPQPIGIIGTIYLGGIGLSEGYYKNDQLNNEKFVDSPFKKGEKIYNTGDLARWLPDGNIDILGRIQRQVKIRGKFIDTVEIENELNKLEHIKQSVVLVQEIAGEKKIIAYLVCETPVNTAHVKEQLKQKIPLFMIPFAFVELAEIPLTPNGKTDRNALPALDSITMEREITPPNTATEHQLVEIWKRVLKIDEIGIHNNFFEIGGHSLLATRIVSIVKSELNKELLISELFLNATVAELASVLDKKTEKTAFPPVTPQAREGRIPLSFAQERLWFIDQLQGSTNYHVPFVFRLTGELDVQLLEQTFLRIINRHEVFRTCFGNENGVPYQVILDRFEWKIRLLEKGSNIQNEIARAFDLSRDLPVRVSLMEENPGSYVIILTMHHIASDGWSISILMEELVEIYNALKEAKPVNLKPLSIQYADFAIWQRKHINEEVLEKELNYWIGQLQGVEALHLPIDFHRPKIQSTNGKTYSLSLPAALTDKLKNMSEQTGATLFMTLFSAFNVLLYKYTGQENICVGTPIANRNFKEIEPLIGFFVNTLAIKTDLSGNPTFNDLLAQVKNTLLNAYDHQNTPFEKIIEKLDIERDLSTSPVFQTMFTFQNNERVDEVSLAGMKVDYEMFDIDFSKFDLSLNLEESEGTVHIDAVYCSDLFKTETIARLFGHYVNLLEQISIAADKKVQHLNMLNREEEALLPKLCNPEITTKYPETLLIERIEQAALIHVGKPALSFNGSSITYEELTERANRLAIELRKNGATANSIVAIHLKNPVNAICAMLGSMKFGAAYLPIDSDYPEQRVNYLLEDSQAAFLICDEEDAVKIKPTLSITILDASVLDHGDASGFEILQGSRSPEKVANIIYTSGSTGNPKGVLVTQKNLADYFNGFIANSCVSECSTFALMSTLSADLGSTVLFSSLLLGGHLHTFELDQLRDADYMHNYMKDNPVDCFKIVPSHWRGLSYETALLPEKMIVFGGEELTPSMVDKIREVRPEINIFNHYGPTETTIGKLMHHLQKDIRYTTVPLGKPFSNSQVFVVDAGGNFCPIGVQGEICIAGDGVTLGYLNRPELTSEKFTNLDVASGIRIYRTGDLGRINEAGEVIFCGRTDDQIKIRGNRIEPGEIQKVMLSTPTVSNAYVDAVKINDGEYVLAAYLEVAESFDMEAFRAFLKVNLPDVYVPANIMVLEKLPLNQNGKINRKALPPLTAADAVQRVLPETEVEKAVCAIWERILNREAIGIMDNFFELGGHSLLITRVISEIRNEFGKEISIREVFTKPTVRELCALLSRDMEQSSAPVIAPHDRKGNLPLSFAQERLWFLDQLDSSVNYNIPIVFSWNGSFNPDHLEKAFQQLLERHEVLRSTFFESEGTPYQQFLSAQNWKLNRIKGTIAQVEPLIALPFDLSKDFLVRGTVIHVSETEHIVVIVKHHIVSDGWSRAIFVNELVQLFAAIQNNEEAPLAALPIQYQDYIFWQRVYLEGEYQQKGLDYWSEQLQNAEVLNLPYDYTRPAIQSKNGSTIHYRLDKALSEQVQAAVLQENVSLFIYLLSAFNVLLHKYSNQHDLTVGTPIANRTQKEVENLIGLFVNTLAIRTRIEETGSFRTLLNQVKDACLNAFEYQHIPFEKVVNHVVNAVDTSRNPIFDVLFSVNNYAQQQDVSSLFPEIEQVEFEHKTSQVDINFNVNGTSEGIELDIEYCTDLFKKESIELLVIHFEEILRSVVAQPEQAVTQINLLSEKERSIILGETADDKQRFFNLTTPRYSNDEPINSRFEAIVNRFENEPAIIHYDTVWTYHELNNFANRIGHLLKEEGMHERSFVGVYMERSPELIGILMGIIKSGSVYVPLDTQNPKYRIQKMIENHELDAVITDKENWKNLEGIAVKKILVISSKEENNTELTHDLAESCLVDRSRFNALPTGNIPNSNDMLSWAYMLFTSGSTGEPKGAITKHDGAINHILAEFELMGLEDKFRFLQSAGIGSDVSVWQMLGPLLKGGAVVIIDKLDLLDYKKAIDIIDGNKVDIVEFVPSYLWGLIHYLQEGNLTLCLDKLKHLMLTGEDAQVSLANILRKTLPHVRIYNCYGPCEASDDVVQFEITEALEDNLNRVPIGIPIPNMNVVVLDKNLNLSPIGIPGEIYISGIGVGAGYYKDEEKTKKAFIPNHFPSLLGDTLYKTGDLGRWRFDGMLEFLGRNDAQVKIRGNRIELGEISSFIRLQPNVKECHLLIHTVDDREVLIAFIVPVDTFSNHADNVLYEIKNAFPAYMVPSHIVQLESLPTNLSDKIDEKKLIQLFQENYRERATVQDENLTKTEEKLIEIWKEELRINAISKYDSFFQIGGHSLLATRVMFKIREAFTLNLPLITLFKYDRVIDLAQYIDVLTDEVEIADEDSLIIEI